VTVGKKGRIDRKDKEFSRVRELAHENKMLQKEVAKLRRQIDKLEGILNMGPREEDLKIVEAPKPKTKARLCHKCGTGFLKLVKYFKAGEDWYYRECNSDSCDHRTRGKRLTPDVQE
jgi:hypothetical protein